MSESGRIELDQERARWRRHYDVHMGQESHHDVDGVMATFGEGAEMIFNGMPFRGRASITAGHLLFGWSATTEGAFEQAHSITDCVFYTHHEVLAHGRFRGRHERDLLGFPGSGRDVELPYAAFYRFDAQGKLVSERIVMDWSPLVSQV
jgi:hypothetical protein